MTKVIPPKKPPKDELIEGSYCLYKHNGDVEYSIGLWSCKRMFVIASAVPVLYEDLEEIRLATISEGVIN